MCVPVKELYYKSAFYSYNFHIFRLFGFGKEECVPTEKSWLRPWSESGWCVWFYVQTVHCIVCRFTCPLFYPVYFSPKNAWSYFEKKNWYRFCRSFHISCTFSFRTAHGNRRTWALLSCSVYIVRIPLPFELFFFLHQCNKIYRLTSKRLLFWCYSPCSEDSEKDSCSNKIKTTCYNEWKLIVIHLFTDKLRYKMKTLSMGFNNFIPIFWWKGKTER